MTNAIADHVEYQRREHEKRLARMPAAKLAAEARRRGCIVQLRADPAMPYGVRVEFVPDDVPEFLRPGSLVRLRNAAAI